MNTAKYKNAIITTEEYNSKIHFNNIFCPDCGKVPLKLIRKANTNPYFKFVSNDEYEHDEMCPHNDKSISQEDIKALVLSDSKKDMSKLNYLVNMNLERSINLLTKVQNNGKLNYNDTLDLMPKKKEFLLKNKVGLYRKKYIESINIKELAEHIEEFKGKYILIYGIASITTSTKGNSKKVLFKSDKNSRFSIFIPPSQQKYFNYDNSIIGAKFAVFGKLKSSEKFINIEIKSTRNLVIV